MVVPMILNFGLKHECRSPDNEPISGNSLDKKTQEVLSVHLREQLL